MYQPPTGPNGEGEVKALSERGHGTKKYKCGGCGNANRTPWEDHIYKTKEGQIAMFLDEKIVHECPIAMPCSKCGQKRCPHEDHNNECTGSNEPNQV